MKVKLRLLCYCCISQTRIVMIGVKWLCVLNDTVDFVVRRRIKSFRMKKMGSFRHARVSAILRWDLRWVRRSLSSRTVCRSLVEGTDKVIWQLDRHCLPSCSVTYMLTCWFSVEIWVTAVALSDNRGKRGRVGPRRRSPVEVGEFWLDKEMRRTRYSCGMCKNVICCNKLGQHEQEYYCVWRGWHSCEEVLNAAAEHHDCKNEQIITDRTMELWKMWMIPKGQEMKK